MIIAIHLRILIAILSFLLLVAIFELIRRGKLLEKYSFLWLAVGVFALIFGIWPDSLTFVSSLLKLHHLTVMLMVTFLFLLSIVLHYSVAISQLDKKNKELTQKLALIETGMKNEG